MPDSMVNRVARAINDSTNPWSWDETTEDRRQGALHAARAAIAAMREPTEGMLQVVYDHSGLVEGCWESMIDAALDTEKEKAG